MNRNFGPMLQIFTAIVFSNASHFFSALALYRLSTLVFNNTEPIRQAIPLVSAVLHVLSPAGLFLTAPYSESLFSLLTMTGYCLYAQAGKSRGGMPRNLGLFMSAILLSVSCTVRSNGILHGIPFLVDFILELRQLSHNFSLAPLLNIVALGICGLLIAGGFVFPQAIAWRQFCLNTPMKAIWCQNTIPSIYFWVQDRYW